MARRPPAAEYIRWPAFRGLCPRHESGDRGRAANPRHIDVASRRRPNLPRDRRARCLANQRCHSGATLMAYFPELDAASDADHGRCRFLGGVQRTQLRFQACADCGQPRHPPTPICPACHSTKMKWIDAPARAEVFTFNVIHHASHPAVAARLLMSGRYHVPRSAGCPSGIERDGLRAILGQDRDAGQLWWDDIGDGLFVPRFRPAKGDAS